MGRWSLPSRERMRYLLLTHRASCAAGLRTVSAWAGAGQSRFRHLGRTALSEVRLLLQMGWICCEHCLYQVARAEGLSTEEKERLTIQRAEQVRREKGRRIRITQEQEV